MKTPWVLIVEDEAEIRESMSSRLEKEGYQVLACGNVSEAGRKCLNQRFGCIVLDYQLESGTGETLLNTIRKNTSNPNHQTPILLISAHMSTEIVKSTGRKIDGALVKPFSRDVLIERVKELCPCGNTENISKEEVNKA